MENRRILKLYEYKTIMGKQIISYYRILYERINSWI